MSLPHNHAMHADLSPSGVHASRHGCYSRTRARCPAALQVVNTIEAAHPDKPRPQLPADVTALTEVRKDVQVVTTQTGSALVRHKKQIMPVTARPQRVCCGGVRWYFRGLPGAASAEVACQALNQTGQCLASPLVRSAWTRRPGPGGDTETLRFHSKPAACRRSRARWGSASAWQCSRRPSPSTLTTSPSTPARARGASGRSSSPCPCPPTRRPRARQGRRARRGRRARLLTQVRHMQRTLCTYLVLSPGTLLVEHADRHAAACAPRMACSASQTQTGTVDWQQVHKQPGLQLSPCDALLCWPGWCAVCEDACCACAGGQTGGGAAAPPPGAADQASPGTSGGQERDLGKDSFGGDDFGSGGGGGEQPADSGAPACSSHLALSCMSDVQSLHPCTCAVQAAAGIRVTTRRLMAAATTLATTLRAMGRVPAISGKVSKAFLTADALV